VIKIAINDACHLILPFWAADCVPNYVANKGTVHKVTAQSVEDFITDQS
jgi:hypothetical protein